MTTKSGQRGVSDFLFNEAASAVRDIREKLFEEAWFGRAVTNGPSIEPSAALEKTRDGQPRFEDLWGSPHQNAMDERERKGQEPEIER